MSAGSEKPGPWHTSPAVAYGAMALLQLKVMWGMWLYKDLSNGDTVHYFANAWDWYAHLRTNIAWSPLYTAYYGSFCWLSEDAHVVTLLHRLALAFLLGPMVLAVMRSLLPHSLAWFLAAWWVVLPINFNTTYEVHLFAVLPIATAWLLALWLPGVWARGCTVAVFALAAILVRNELVVAAGALGLACAGWELKTRREPRRRMLLAYGLPLALALALCGLCYVRSIVKGPMVSLVMSAKHTVNMAQVYSFGYQQRHPGVWKKNPWIDHAELMRAHFGTELPTLGQMLLRNPAATIEHGIWNLKLVPAGLQLLLFNAVAGPDSPDYSPATLNSRIALVLWLITVIVLGLGFYLIWMERRHWWENWARERAFGLAAMAAVLLVAPAVILTQRPRPSYFLATGILVMAAVGLCLLAISRRWPALRRLSPLAPALMVIVLLVAPPYYVMVDRFQPRPTLDMYERLSPFRDLFADDRLTVLANPGTRHVVAYYIGRNRRKYERQILEYPVLDSMPAGMPIHQFLEQRGVGLLYAEETFLTRYERDPLHREFFSNPEKVGWRLVASRNHNGANWKLIRREGAGARP